MMYEPEIYPTHIMMDKEVAKTPRGIQMKNDLFARCTASNKPAFWIIENEHRNGRLYGDYYITREQGKRVANWLQQRGFKDAVVMVNMLDSGYGCGLALKHLARDLFSMLTEEEEKVAA